MLNKRIILSLVSLLLVQQAASSLFGSGKVQLIDKDPLDVTETLNKLCSDPSQRIGKVSTISWLLRQFEASNDQSLADCKGQYLDPLRALNEVTSSHVDNVCSLDKVKLIDQFQWNYQMGAMSSKWMKFAHGPLPEPLKVFFLHYVTEIASTCKQNLPDNIELAAAQKDSSQDKSSTLSENFGVIMKKFQQVLIPFDKIRHYDNFVLLWDMLINHERKKNNDILLRDPTSGEGFIALIKAKDAAKVWQAQQRCRRILRPVYKDTVLPVMKLIDMGYDVRDKQLDQEFEANEVQKDWYMLTQTCELLLPVKFYEDKHMKFWEMGNLNSFEEAEKFAKEPISEQQPSQVKANAISIPDELKSAVQSDETKLIKLVLANTKNRGHLYRKILRSSAKNSLSKTFGHHKQLLSMLKKLKLTGSGKNSQADDDVITEESMHQTEKFLEEDEKLDNEVAIAGSHNRVKRDMTSPRAVRNVTIIFLVLMLFLGFLWLLSHFGVISIA